MGASRYEIAHGVENEKRTPCFQVTTYYFVYHINTVALYRPENRLDWWNCENEKLREWNSEKCHY